ncbi:MAG: hypothetical protein A3C30_01240 [Candidatus Levybacteria bacterium RIFCSPHIGHO2_02_FULL_40_18]|nr:MAG: hypothetical protein A2869_00805 [Candidatus Levybacteria bacterium RIFCSPHIGHO2_01_FULL_40_58]OGH26628.1 MAG: hypothetical protein A3C30_01240 [Candidatus Levybacteria bacterium RIFCSPHIGHO2_02_FULL_40_18]OGH31157.1 MAG: hypothetical protein A3E43_00075 [Candidatus Levybacteria bacterium RIFCSPHIGHO2_12_FULL_40_31]OGH39839.1 MAG: hypothetical protein A2894_03580 [Candidatus Levybacteria bacterium RIFCSPLOWO2_01_FULL_40_64]OGH48863.1 MAG: hypothetical protein A3I54_04685 [Candidatus Lev
MKSPEARARQPDFRYSPDQRKYSKLNPFSPLELKILQATHDGLTGRQIAISFGVSAKSLTLSRRRIKEKMLERFGVSESQLSIEETIRVAVELGIRNGLIEPKNNKSS